MKKLISNENSIEITYENFYRTILSEFKGSFKGQEMPSSLKEFDILVNHKKSYLFEELDVNLTASKQKKARNIIAKMIWDLRNGYQSIKGTWDNIIDRYIQALNESKKMPLEVILVKDNCEDLLLKLKDSSNLDTSIKRYGFKNENEMLLQYEELDNDSHFEEMEESYEAILNTAFFASEVAVDTGNVSCGGSMGFGDSLSDVEYLKSSFGISFIGDHDGYYAVDSSDSAILAVKMIRLSDERIDGMITMLNSLKKDF